MDIMRDDTNGGENSYNIKIGHSYSVKRLDGEYCPAEVLEMRTLSPNQVEYFVHFENSKSLQILNLKIWIFLICYQCLADKRLDEWTDIEKFDLNKGELTKHSKIDSENTNDPSERKLTRNQKRKNDITSTVILIWFIFKACIFEQFNFHYVVTRNFDNLSSLLEFLELSF